MQTFQRTKQYVTECIVSQFSKSENVLTCTLSSNTNMQIMNVVYWQIGAKLLERGALWNQPYQSFRGFPGICMGLGVFLAGGGGAFQEIPSLSVNYLRRPFRILV